MTDQLIASAHCRSLTDTGYKGGTPATADPAIDHACRHLNVVEGCDEEGKLIEPPFDICIDCGHVFN